MKKKSLIGTIASVSCLAMILSGCGGETGDTTAIAANTAVTDISTPTSATAATSVVTADPLNITYIQEHFACDEDLASEISLALAEEGFGQITESTSISSTKAKIKDSSGMISYLILDEYGVIIELIDENESQLWANGSIAYTLEVPSDSSTTTTTQVGDVEVTIISNDANSGGSTDTSTDPTTGSSIPTSDTNTSDNAATASTTVNSDFCTIEVLEAGKYKVTPNGALSDSIKIGNTTMGKVASKFDNVLTSGGFDSINRTLYYQLISTTFFSYDGVSSSMDMDEAKILAYLSSMTEGNTTLKYTEIACDSNTDYMKYTYYIGTSTVTIDTDNVVTWDGTSVDNINEILDLFNKDSSSAESTSNAASDSTTTSTLETATTVIDSANIKAVSENKASSTLAQEIHEKFGGYVTKIEKSDSGWTCTLDNGKSCLITYSIINDKVTIKVAEDSKKDPLITLTY